MTRWAQGFLIALVAALLLKLGLTDDHLLYVKAAMQPWLVLSGVVLAALALPSLLEGWGERRGGTEDRGHDHDHDGGERLAFLLVIPFLVVFLVAPGPLGAFAASRQSAREPAAPDVTFRFPTLSPPRDGAVDLSLRDFVSRAVFDSDRSLEGTQVRLTGFVVQEEGVADGFLLTRFVLACCAADGAPIQVAVRDASWLPSDTWVEVVGTWLPEPGPEQLGTPRLGAASIREVPQPVDPYES